MDDVVILGCGLHPFGRWPDKSVEEMGRVAVRQALDDANLEFGDIQVAYTGRVYSGMGAGLHVVNELGQTGIPVVNIEMACASSSSALIQGHHVVGAGVYDIALVVGFEKMDRGLINVSPGRSYDVLMGFSAMPAQYALMATRYMEDFGATEEMFAQVSVKSHRNGALNPNAQYQREVSLEEVLDSRMIADPIHLLECSPTTDGASAVVIARRGVAEKFKARHRFRQDRGVGAGKPCLSANRLPGAMSQGTWHARDNRSTSVRACWYRSGGCRRDASPRRVLARRSPVH